MNARFIPLAFAMLLLGGCAAATPERPDTGRATPETVVSTDTVPTAGVIETQADIYAAVIERLWTKDDPFDGGLPKPVTYIVAQTDAAASDANPDAARPVSLAMPLRDAITSHLDHLDTTLRWVDAFDDVARDPDTGAPQDAGVIITLGSIHAVGDERVQVPATLFASGLAAGGTTYVVENRDGRWQIVGTTGPSWIS